MVGTPGTKGAGSKIHLKYKCYAILKKGGSDCYHLCFYSDHVGPLLLLGIMFEFEGRCMLGENVGSQRKFLTQHPKVVQISPHIAPLPPLKHCLNPLLPFLMSRSVMITCVACLCVRPSVRPSYVALMSSPRGNTDPIQVLPGASVPR